MSGPPSLMAASPLACELITRSSIQTVFKSIDPTGHTLPVSQAPVQPLHLATTGKVQPGQLLTVRLLRRVRGRPPAGGLC